jgi:hypothetical protein
MEAPSAKRSILVLLAGIFWSGVGVALLAVATNWLLSVHEFALISLGVGAIIGLAVYRFGFSRLARTNLTRIFSQAPGKDRVCLFAFQNTRSYIIMATMMGLGYTLRHLPIPRLYLAPVYLAIGLGLLLSSLVYYRHVT